jgi:hypothetical protein
MASVAKLLGVMTRAKIYGFDNYLIQSSTCFIVVFLGCNVYSDTCRAHPEPYFASAIRSDAPRAVVCLTDMLRVHCCQTNHPPESSMANTKSPPYCGTIIGTPDGVRRSPRGKSKTVSVGERYMVRRRCVEAKPKPRFPPNEDKSEKSRG